MSWPLTKSSVQTEQARPLSALGLSEGCEGLVPGWVSVVTVSRGVVGEVVEVGSGVVAGWEGLMVAVGEVGWSLFSIVPSSTSGFG